MIRKASDYKTSQEEALTDKEEKMKIEERKEDKKKKKRNLVRSLARKERKEKAGFVCLSFLSISSTVSY